MKARFLKITSFIITAALLLTATAFSALVSGAEQAAPSFTVITVSANEIQTRGAFKAIQAALNSARYCATKDNIYKVVVEPGSYDLRAALHVYSNTTLSLQNVTLVRNSLAVCNIIRTGDDTACDKGGTGYGTNTNITIEGGALDGGGTSNTMVKVTHATNFSMVGTELRNTNNAHIMEVAAVDGFSVRSCVFKDQMLDVDGIGAEAIQFDIPKEGTIVGCRSEALSDRNITITGCTFSNCPRAIGSHTLILNVPHENIVISDNTFSDIKSVAIQAEYWKNVKIINNTIENTPRAIAFYSVYGNGSGCFRPSVLAKEGKTETSASDKFYTPFNANILIENNTISGCGTFKDVYGSDEPAAISMYGNKFDKTGKVYPEGGGGIPKGDYYITGVTIKNNGISAACNGIYLNNVRNIRVSKNKVACSNGGNTKRAVNPLTSLTVNFNAISDNDFSASPSHGMELALSAIGEISGNSVTDAAQDGILLEANSKVTGSITKNYIGKVGRYGVNIRPGSAGGTITDNIISNCGKGAVQKEKNASGSVGENYYEVVKMTSLSLNMKSVTLGDGEKCTLTPSYAPVNVVAKFTWSSANTLVASVNENGVVTACGVGETDITVTSADGNTATCHVKVLPEPESIRLNETMLTIGRGESVKLSGQLSEGTMSRRISFVSNNPNAVTVSADGTVTGISLGTATVVAKTYNGKHACCNVIVKDAPYDIWFDNSEICTGVGEFTSLSLILPDGAASHSVKYAAENENIVSVGQNGELQAKTVGETTVTATAYNGATAICRVTVKHKPDEVGFAQSEYDVIVGEVAQPEVVFGENSASHALSFQSSDPDICHINRTTGEITAKKAGTVTLTVKTYNHVSGTCRVTVHEN